MEQFISGSPPKKSYQIDQPTPDVALNITCVLADTEYSQLLPADTRKIIVKGRNYIDVKIAFVAEKSGSEYVTAEAGRDYSLEGNFSNKTIYLQTPTAGGVVEILCCK